MPQIPIVNPSQRIDPSSPVQVASTTESGLGSRMASALGEAIFSLGDMLDRSNAVRDSKDRQLEMQLYTDEIEKLAQAESNRLASAATDPSDIDGTKTVEAFRSKLKEESEKIRSKYRPDLDKELAVAFGRVTNQYAGSIYASESAKRDKGVAVKYQSLISSYTSKAIKDPNSVETSYDNGRNAILDSTFIEPSLKEQELNKFGKDIYKSAIIGRMDLAKSVRTDDAMEFKRGLEQFSEAERLVRTKFSTFATPEEVDKQLDDIDKTRTAWVAQANSIDDRNIKFAEQAKKEANELAEKEYIAKVLQAGNKTDVLTSLRESFKSDARFLDLSASTQEKLLRLNFSQDLDDKYELQFKERLIFGTKADKYEMLKKELAIDSRGTNAKVSVPKASELLTKLDSERDKTNPEMSKYINEKVNEIEQRYTTKTLDPMSGREIISVSMAGRQAVSKFRGSMVTVYDKEGVITKASVDAAFRTIMGPYPNDITGVDPGVSFDIKQLPNAITNAARDLKYNKNMSKKEKRELLEKARQMKKNLDVLKGLERTQIKSEPMTPIKTQTTFNK